MSKPFVALFFGVLFSSAGFAAAAAPADDVAQRLVAMSGGQDVAADDPRVTQTRKLLDKAGVRHDMVIRTGHIAAEIAAAASEGGFDLLVLGSKGRSSLKDLLIGSVAQRVSELSKVPVLLVK